MSVFVARGLVRQVTFFVVPSREVDSWSHAWGVATRLHLRVRPSPPVGVGRGAGVRRVAARLVVPDVEVGEEAERVTVLGEALARGELVVLGDVVPLWRRVERRLHQRVDREQRERRRARVVQVGTEHLEQRRVGVRVRVRVGVRVRVRVGSG